MSSRNNTATSLVQNAPVQALFICVCGMFDEWPLSMQLCTANLASCCHCQLQTKVVQLPRLNQLALL
jgi:hypothetical protein